VTTAEGRKAEKKRSDSKEKKLPGLQVGQSCDVGWRRSREWGLMGSSHLSIKFTIQAQLQAKLH
jgi:hypothetical protein